MCYIGAVQNQLSVSFWCIKQLPILLLIFLSSEVFYAQAGLLDLQINGNQRRVDIPFRLENNFIIVPVVINNIWPVNFIIDTGAEHTIILDRTLTDATGTDYQRVYDIVGSDLSTTIQALLAVGVTLRIGENLTALNRSVLVLSENRFNFQELTGVPITGIIGGDFLMRFVVEIDYHKQILRLHEPSGFRPSRKHEILPTEFHRNRAFLQTNISMTGSDTVSRLLLIDSGASLGLLLLSKPEDDISLPETTIFSPIANGLGGKIMGIVGRARNCQIGEQQLGAMVLFFQNLPPFMDSLQLEREGIIGNRALQRFNLVIDYPRQIVYAKPVGRWPERFPFDRSGLLISAGGRNLNQYQIISVVPNSPAAEAGLQVGDIIRRLNGTPGVLLTLDGINRKLESKVGRKIRIVAERNGVILNVEFQLRDLI